MNADSEKQSKIDQAENKVKYLEDQCEEYQESITKKYNVLKENVNNKFKLSLFFKNPTFFSQWKKVFKIQKIVDEDKSNREQTLEIKMKEILSLDQKFSQSIESEILTRKDGENRLLRLLDDKFNLIKSEIVREGKLRAESIDQLNQCLEVFSSLHL